MWEMRGPRQHFTYSKVMAWVAADRMVDSVNFSGLPGPVERWKALRDRIHAEVLCRGFDSDHNTFIQSYGSTDLDASLLLIGRVGFLPGDDPRIIATVDAIQRRLTQDGFVLRYHTGSGTDGLPGCEGVFLACSFWLVDALLGVGRPSGRYRTVERLLALRNDVGLLSGDATPSRSGSSETHRRPSATSLW
jgi:GH15 family glucan-1,4-alpha-glucosidase